MVGSLAMGRNGIGTPGTGISKKDIIYVGELMEGAALARGLSHVYSIRHGKTHIAEWRCCAHTQETTNKVP